jgi:hypothetical protein
VSELEHAREGRLGELDTGTSEAVLDSVRIACVCVCVSVCLSYERGGQALMGIDMDRGWRTMHDGARRLVVGMLELLRTDFRCVGAGWTGTRREWNPPHTGELSETLQSQPTSCAHEPAWAGSTACVAVRISRCGSDCA